MATANQRVLVSALQPLAAVVRHDVQRRCTVRRERRRQADDVAHEHLIERIRRVPELEAQLAIERDLG
jgi:hypothetical protein